jgi:hypothetical protein
MTGQAQTQGWSAAQFKSQVCNAINGAFNCSSSVYIDVETYSSFAAVNLGMPIKNGSFNASSLGYNPGGPGAILDFNQAIKLNPNHAGALHNRSLAKKQKGDVAGAEADMAAARKINPNIGR